MTNKNNCLYLSGAEVRCHACCQDQDQGRELDDIHADNLDEHQAGLEPHGVQPKTKWMIWLINSLCSSSISVESKENLAAQDRPWYQIVTWGQVENCVSIPTSRGVGANVFKYTFFEAFLNIIHS